MNNMSRSQIKRANNILFETQMQHNMAKKCHKIAVEKGWWEEKRTKSEIVILIFSELFEAFEALRGDKWADNQIVVEKEEEEGIPIAGYKVLFEMHIKDTVEDEIADTMIRIFDFLGSCESYNTIQKEKVFDRIPFRFSYELHDYFNQCFFMKEYNPTNIEYIFNFTIYIANEFNIDLKNQMELKLEYNKLRSHRHGGKKL